MLQDGRVSAVAYLTDGLLIMSWPVWFLLLTVFCGDKEGGLGIWVRLQGGETIEVGELHGLAVLDQTCCTVCWSAFVVVHELI